MFKKLRETTLVHPLTENMKNFCVPLQIRSKGHWLNRPDAHQHRQPPQSVSLRRELHLLKVSTNLCRISLTAQRSTQIQKLSKRLWNGTRFSMIPSTRSTSTETRRIYFQKISWSARTATTSRSSDKVFVVQRATPVSHKIALITSDSRIIRVRRISINIIWSNWWSERGFENCFQADNIFQQDFEHCRLLQRFNNEANIGNASSSAASPEWHRVVYNCSVDVTPDQMFRFFVGILITGAWLPAKVIYRNCCSFFTDCLLCSLINIIQIIKNSQTAYAWSFRTSSSTTSRSDSNNNKVPVNNEEPVPDSI